ncbi:hypothetical protein KF728_28885 [Candidatus Obscuribacterales bacterium]|nr:hypothetical protein [Candidatus Obscuribacterales bacterium]MBX3154202.1 hypothetical protein [Candidatus Obscuribacterales bacterium]
MPDNMNQTESQQQGTDLRLMLAQADALCMEGRFEEAASIYQYLVGMTEGRLGPNHPDTVLVVQRLADALYQMNAFRDCLPLYERLCQIARGMLGDSDPDVINLMFKIARTQELVGSFVEARSTYEFAIATAKQHLPPNHQLGMQLQGRYEVLLERMEENKRAAQAWKENTVNSPVIKVPEPVGVLEKAPPPPLPPMPNYPGMPGSAPVELPPSMVPPSMAPPPGMPAAPPMSMQSTSMTSGMQNMPPGAPPSMPTDMQGSPMAPPSMSPGAPSMFPPSMPQAPAMPSMPSMTGAPQVPGLQQPAKAALPPHMMLPTVDENILEGLESTPWADMQAPQNSPGFGNDPQTLDDPFNRGGVEHPPGSPFSDNGSASVQSAPFDTNGAQDPGIRSVGAQLLNELGLFDAPPVTPSNNAGMTPNTMPYQGVPANGSMPIPPNTQAHSPMNGSPPRPSTPLVPPPGYTPPPGYAPPPGYTPLPATAAVQSPPSLPPNMPQPNMPMQNMSPQPNLPQSSMPMPNMPPPNMPSQSMPPQNFSGPSGFPSSPDAQQLSNPFGGGSTSEPPSRPIPVPPSPGLQPSFSRGGNNEFRPFEAPNSEPRPFEGRMDGPPRFPDASSPALNQPEIRGSSVGGLQSSVGAPLGTPPGQDSFSESGRRNKPDPYLDHLAQKVADLKAQAQGVESEPPSMPPAFRPGNSASDSGWHEGVTLPTAPEKQFDTGRRKAQPIAYEPVEYEDMGEESGFHSGQPSRNAPVKKVKTARAAASKSEDFVSNVRALKEYLIPVVVLVILFVGGYVFISLTAPKTPPPATGQVLTGAAAAQTNADVYASPDTSMRLAVGTTSCTLVDGPSAITAPYVIYDGSWSTIAMQAVDSLMEKQIWFNHVPEGMITDTGTILFDRKAPDFLVVEKMAKFASAGAAFAAAGQGYPTKAAQLQSQAYMYANPFTGQSGFLKLQVLPESRGNRQELISMLQNGSLLLGEDNFTRGEVRGYAIVDSTAGVAKGVGFFVRGADRNGNFFRLRDGGQVVTLGSLGGKDVSNCKIAQAAKSATAAVPPERPTKVWIAKNQQLPIFVLYHSLPITMAIMAFLCFWRSLMVGPGQEADNATNRGFRMFAYIAIGICLVSAGLQYSHWL